jgi:hypothetical protein
MILRAMALGSLYPGLLWQDMKDESGKYFVAPMYSKSNTAHSENIIPIDWFVLFSEEDRKSLYTHWGFNAIHYDTRIETALGRINDALDILSGCFEKHDQKKLQSLFANNLSVLSQSLSGLQTWFSGFEESGFIVLNYGDICSFIHINALNNERSVHEIWHFLHQLEQIEMGCLQLNPARLDLGDVQHVVDQVQQVFAAAIDKVQILLLIRSGMAIIVHQLRKSQNGVQGGAQFVAHMRQESALGPVGQFR